MRFVRVTMVLMMVFAVLFSVAAAQERGGRGGGGQRGAQPTPGQRGERGAEAARGGRGGRGGQGAIQAMTLVTTAWPDGGQIPPRYTQMGAEVSPGVQWSNVPANTASFVLIFRDLDTVTGPTAEPLLHWLVWNIPGAATSIPFGRPDGFQLEDGSRQISASGSRYRGPGASATGPMHHYIMELYALDKMLDVNVTPPNPQGPNPSAAAIRDAIFQAMRPDPPTAEVPNPPGHIRGKGTYVGLFRRPQ